MPVASSELVLTKAELASRLSSLQSYGIMSPLERVSLGGFQDKLALSAANVVVEEGYVREAEWAVAEAARISTHILKPQPLERYEGLVEGEAWAMAVARCAARCSKTALLDLPDAPITLLVERYDREQCSHGLVRLHQEDCCQALGIDPTGKYASSDMAKGADPTYEKIASILSLYASDPDEELAELMRQLVTNLVLGNVDAHAKNYSLLYRKTGVPELSPLYDVVPVQDIEPRAKYASLRVAGKIVADEVGREDVLAEVEAWGLGEESASELLDQTLDKLQEGMQAAGRLYPSAACRHEGQAMKRLGRLASCG